MQANRIGDYLKVMTSNGMLLISGLIIAFLLPVKLSVEEYGYWQFYFFYSGFVGFFMFGFSDGIHLKYVGENYKYLDKKLFRLYFRAVVLITVIVLILVTLWVLLFVDHPDRVYTLLFISLNIVIININGFFTHVNQITSRFGFYSWGITLDRIVFVFSIVPMFFLPFDSYKHYIIVNIISRLVVVLYNLITSKDLVFGKTLRWKEGFQNILDNFKVGIFLTISAVLSMVLISYTRILVDKFMGISEFGLYSFANSILSIAIQIVIAVATVLYPLLKNTDQSKYESFIALFNQSILIIGALMLSVYFPVEFLIEKYLVKYLPILDYLYFLFPMMLYQCKNNIVILTFYKVLRSEKILLINTAVGLIVNIIVTIISFQIFGTVLSIVAASVTGYALWCYYAEWYLLKKYQWSSTNITADFLVIVGFTLSTQIQHLLMGLLVYLLILVVIGSIYRKSLQIWLYNVKSIIRS